MRRAMWRTARRRPVYAMSGSTRRALNKYLCARRAMHRADAGTAAWDDAVAVARAAWLVYVQVRDEHAYLRQVA